MKLITSPRFFFVLIVSLVFSAPLFSYAQISGRSSSSSNDISQTITPKYPKPNEEVKIDLDSYVFNIDSSSISWAINGKTISQGVGKKNFSLSAGPIGSRTVVRLIVSPKDRAPIETSIVITPSLVHFVWEAKTYTPPFYKGKALFTEQSQMVVTAAVELTGTNGILPPDSLIYNWKQDDSVLTDQSGYGKKSVIIQGNYWGRDEPITVDVSSADGSSFIEATTLITPQKPEAIVYESNPLLGVLYNQALGGIFSLSHNSEVTFFAAPYFSSVDEISNSKTTYLWSMNGNTISDQSNGNTITFRDDSGNAGMSKIHVDITQPNISAQPSTTDFSINFK